MLAGAAARITRKERTCREIEAWLEGEGADQALVSELVERLVELRLLDDENFAYVFAEDKRERSGWGSDRIQQALLDRGIAYELAASAASVGSEGEAERALATLLKKGYDLEDPGERQKALGLLARRGYPAETAYDAIRQARHSASSGSQPDGHDLSSGAAPTR